MKMCGWKLLAPLLAILLWQFPLSAFSKPVSAEKADVRVLIDISGSMKQNDPKNLRRPALRLLVGLLPKDTRAGVWTFAQYVNMQIPLGQVDDAWKNKARASSKKISSPGQFTNIEGALTRATEDWSGQPTLYRRSVVLLTDGMVDVSRSKQRNLASRQRILQEVIPRLQALGVSVHTIALSKNADHDLMRELAESTDGWYEQVENAEQLQRVFLRIFEKVGKPDAVPLKDNKFTIDQSVTEATVLVFHKPDGRQTQLISPGGEPYSADTAPPSIVWHRDEGYDMLTINDPQAGEWKILADVDPDNRVMVVTDLRMKVSELPNRFIHGQSMPVEVSFSDHGRHIRKPAFLKVVTVSATQQDETGKSESKPVMDDGRSADDRPGDGNFTLQFGGGDLHRGVGELVVNATGQTFVREKRMTYEVVPPVILEAKPGEQSNQLEVSIAPDEALVDISTMQTSAWMEDGQGDQFFLEMVSDVSGASQGVIDLMGFSGSRQIFVKATGKTKGGRSLEYLDSPIEVEGLMPPPLEVKALTASEPVPVVTASGTESVAEPEPVAKIVQDEQLEEDDWMLTSIWFAVINLILLLAGGVGYWWVRKRNQKSLVTLMEEEVSASLDTAEEKAA